MDLRVHFPHGLGDCVYFAHALPLYIKRGFHPTVSCAPDKNILFAACGADIVHDNLGFPVVSWHESRPLKEFSQRNYPAYNKGASNFGQSPMPEIGTPESLWDEFAGVRLDLRSHIALEHWGEAREFLKDLPRPVILLHTIGNTSQDTKSLPADMTVELYRELLDVMDGTLVLLDWDNRVPRLSSYRVRHLVDDWKWIALPSLMALIYESDLIMGIDSGPFHAARFTDTPSIGIFPHPFHYPLRYTLPRARQLCIVPKTQTHKWNQKVRIAYNIIHCEGETITAKFLATNAVAMLRGPRYLKATHLAADVQMQQFILDFERGYGNNLSGYVDRHNSYDRLFQIIKQRYSAPLIVETGCIRCDEDWRGAGYSTYLFGAYVDRAGGELISIDNSPDHCRFAQAATAEFRAVRIHCGDSVSFLRTFDRPIDVLQLDSMDTELVGHADHAVSELEAALPHLHDQSIVIFDDTVCRASQWHGKGAKAVPLMLERGWRVVYSGYQTILERVR